MTEDQRYMLDELLDDDSDRLTAWEVEFIESLDRNCRRRDLTERQQKTLQNIYEKVTDAV